MYGPFRGLEFMTIQGPMYFELVRTKGFQAILARGFRTILFRAI